MKTLAVFNPETLQIAYVEISMGHGTFVTEIPKSTTPRTIDDYMRERHYKWRTARRSLERKGYTKMIKPEYITSISHVKFYGGENLEKLRQKIIESAQPKNGGISDEKEKDDG